jgi:hypothetical protein
VLEFCLSSTLLYRTHIDFTLNVSSRYCRRRSSNPSIENILIRSDVTIGYIEVEVTDDITGRL